MSEQLTQSSIVFRRRSQKQRSDPQLQLGFLRHENPHAFLLIDQLKAAGQRKQTLRQIRREHSLLGHCIGCFTHWISRRFPYCQS